MSPAEPLRFLVDAQLPKRLADFLAFHTGCDCLHTLDLPAANQTQDGHITRLSMAERRILITKDADFVNSFLLHGQLHSCCSYRRVISVRTIYWRFSGSFCRSSRSFSRITRTWNCRACCW